ncbi:MAG: alpha/beta fold hydrolase, partial [Candidatus Dormibacteria bacterium]
SAQHVAAYRMSELAGDVRAIVTELGADRYHVIGHDWGGTVAWTLAGDDDHRLQSVTVLSTAHSLALLHALRGIEQRARFSYMAVLQVPRLPEAMFSAAGGVVVERMLMATGLPRAIARRDVDHLRRVGPTGALNWYRALRIQPRERPRPSAVPSLYVWGAGDAAFGRDAAEQTEQHVNAPYHFVELEGASHWIPDLYWRDIDDLVRDHLGPARRTTRASTRRRPARARATS